MPQPSLTDLNPPAPPPTTMPVTSPSYQTALNDAGQTSVNALTNYVQGSQWTVTWYSQILGGDNELMPFDVNRPVALQQYKKIINLTLMVTSPLQRSQDQESKEFEVTGTAIAYGFLLPNAGDTFIATIDNGRQAIFNVTSSEKATYMKASNYVINYKLVSYTDPVLTNNLDAKSVQTFQFVSSLLAAGQYPLLTSDQYALYEGLGDLYTNLLSVYFRDFFSVEYQTFLVPGQDFTTYDPFLTQAMVNLVSTDQNLRLPRVRQPAVRGDLTMVNVCVWDALLEVNRTSLLTGFQRAGIVTTADFRNFPNLTGIAYTGIDQIVYPRDPRTDIDAEHEWVADNAIDPYQEGQMRYQSLARNLRASEMAFFETACQCVEGADGQTILPPIVSVTQDDYYVFTAGFYEVHGKAYASQLEIMVANTIKGQAPDRNQLMALGQQAFAWPNLERYYYTPMLLAMMVISQQSSAT